MKPLAVVLYLEETDRRQNVIADKIRENWAELIALSPAARKQRIDEILDPKPRGVGDVRATVRERQG